MSEVSIKVVLEIRPLGGPGDGFNQSVDRVEVEGFTDEVKDATTWELPDVAWEAKHALDELYQSSDEAGLLVEIPTPFGTLAVEQLVKDALEWSRRQAGFRELSPGQAAGLVLAFMQGMVNVRAPGVADDLLELRGLRRSK